MLRKKNGGTYKNTRSRLRLKIPFAFEPVIRVDHGVAGEFQLVSQLTAGRQRLPGLQSSLLYVLLELPDKLILQGKATITIQPDTSEGSHPRLSLDPSYHWFLALYLIHRSGKHERSVSPIWRMVPLERLRALVLLQDADDSSRSSARIFTAISAVNASHKRTCAWA